MSEPTSIIGLGTAAIGRPQYINIRQEAVTEFSPNVFREKGIDVLDAAYEQGVRYFDTAPNYGLAEGLLIDWITDKDDIEIATKWGYTYVANFDPNALNHEQKEHSLAKLNEQWVDSKALLPLLTTYQNHSATFETGVLDNEKILNRLAHLKNEYGLLLGITTTGVNQQEVIEKALGIVVEDRQLFDVYQLTYNVFDQSLAVISKDLVAQNKRIVVKEAMANGRIFPNEQYPHYAKAYNYLQMLAERYEVGIDAIALRFCIDSMKPFKVLSGAANTQHLSSNLKASQFQLEENELELLKATAVAPAQYWNERKQLAWN
jgi:aryl-alcohol dehydrogenase-like predicted oxidoreductase